MDDSRGITHKIELCVPQYFIDYKWTPVMKLISSVSAKQLPDPMLIEMWNALPC